MTEKRKAFRKCPCCGKRFECEETYSGWTGDGPFYDIPEHTNSWKRNERCPGSGQEGLTKKQAKAQR